MRLLAIALVVTGLLAVVPRAHAATAARPGLLYVGRADGGRLTSAGKGRFRLELRVGATPLSTFTDRPGRSAGSERVRAFVARWAARGFAADPPNAALVVDGARTGADVAMLTLSQPRLSRGVLRFTARPLRTTDGGALETLRRRGDTVRAGRFGRASLFVDNGATTIYQPLEFDVSNAAPGEKIAVQLTPNRSPVAFSTGPPFQIAGGLQIEAQSGSLPLSAFNVDESEATFLTVSSGAMSGSLSFSISLFLAADAGVSDFYLRSSSDPGVQVSAQVGNAQPQVVDQTDTLFAWAPI
jgi:hypothetical protein